MRSEWLYSGKAFLAGMLAFYLALLLQLPNPYWSFATVYIVSHPLSGATRSKGVYRAIGTVTGALVALVLVPALAESPLWLVVAIGAWMGVALFISLSNNTPSAYSFLLASYTTPLIAVPAILAPGSIFDIALARTEEILLGIVCASVVSIAVFPSRVSPVFHARVTVLLKDAGRWASQRLTHLGESAPPPLRLRLLTDVLALDTLIGHLAYDATRAGQTDEARQIRLRMTMLVPQVASLADALAALDEPAGDRDTALQRLLDDTMAWMDDGIVATIAMGDALRIRAWELKEPLASTALTHALRAHAIDRLGELIDLWQDCLMLQDAFMAHRPRPPLLTYRARALDQRTRHDDRRSMLLAAASPALAVVATGWLWLLSGWPGGSAGVVLVAIATAFFAATDDPSRHIKRFLAWQATSIVTAGAYLFCILPHVTSFVGVVLVMAPFFIVLGAFTGRPAMTTGVVLTTSQTITAIALQNNTLASFEDFINSATGMMLGLGFALAWTMVTRPLGGVGAAHRLAVANARDQAELAQTRSAPRRLVLAARVLDRTMQALPRMALATGESLVHMDAVRDMRLCLALLDLRDEDGDIGPVLAAARAYFRECVAQRTRLPPPATLVQSIDEAMRRHLTDDERLAQRLLAFRLALAVPPERAHPTSASPSLPFLQPTAQ